MILLVPLAIFFILCVVMVVALVHSYPPTAIDTVEALCDAILRDDTFTQGTLMTTNVVPADVINAMAELKDAHNETAKTYQASIIREWDDSNASYALISIPLPDEESVYFTCRFVVNQWTITGLGIGAHALSVES